MMTKSQNNTQNQEWLKKLHAIILAQMHNDEFGLEILAEKLLMSKSTLQRQIKKRTGKTPKQYVNELRLQKAKQLILQKQFNIAKEVAYAIGFANTAHFTHLFQERYGETPKKMIQQVRISKDKK